MSNKEYLGDGAYAEIVPGGLELTTSNGIDTTNAIVLGEDELGALAKYLRSHAPVFAGKFAKSLGGT